MMKRIICLMLCLAIFIGGNSMASTLISAEQLLEMSGLTENDVPFNALSEIIKRYNLTEDALMDVSKEEIAEGLLEILPTAYKNRYTYLFEAETINSPEWRFDVNDVVRVATYLSYGILKESVLIDFKEKKCYYDESSYFFKDVLEAERIVDLSEDLYIVITKSLEKAPWHEWNYTYEGENGIDVSDWYFVIETSEGVIRYSIIGNAIDAPKGLIQLAYDMMQPFK